MAVSLGSSHRSPGVFHLYSQPKSFTDNPNILICRLTSLWLKPQSLPASATALLISDGSQNMFRNNEEIICDPYFSFNPSVLEPSVCIENIEICTTYFFYYTSSSHVLEKLNLEYNAGIKTPLLPEFMRFLSFLSEITRQGIGRSGEGV